MANIKAAFADAGSLNRSFVSKQGADDLNMDDNAVPVVIRAIRQRCGLTQREAGLLFGTGGETNFSPRVIGRPGSALGMVSG